MQVGTTFGGAACIRGNLTPECNAAVQAVLDDLGKRMRDEGVGDVIKRREAWLDRHAATLTAALTAP